MKQTKAIVIGVDGVSWSLIERLTSEGDLPNIAGLIKNGTAGPLESTIIPITPVAWSTSFTGLNPGKMGVYGFFKRDKKEYKWIPVSAADRKGKDVWQIVGEHGLFSIIAGLPFTYPPRPFNGLLVGGCFSLGSGYTYPEELEEYLKEKGFKYPLPKCKSLAEVKKSLTSRFELANELLSKYDCDLFMLGFEQLEQAHHRFYVSDFSEIIKGYRFFDDLLGKFLENVSEQTTVMMYSDHGHVRYDKWFYLPSWLYSEGFLKKNKVRERFKIRKCRIRRGLKIVGMKNPGLLRRLFMQFIFITKELLGHRLFWLKRMFPGLKIPKSAKPSDTFLDSEDEITFGENFDFSRSSAFPHSSSASGYGGIFINEREKFPSGIVEPLDYESVRDKIIKRLYEIRDKRSGEKIISYVWKKEDIYYGEFIDEAPDILFETKPEYSVVIRSQVLDKEYIHYSPISCHELDGTIIVCGPEIENEGYIRANIIQITPTILHLLGLSMPEEIDGKPIVNVFKQSWLEKHPVRVQEKKDISDEETEEKQAFSDKVYTEEEQKEIMLRLKEMGYI